MKQGRKATEASRCASSSSWELSSPLLWRWAMGLRIFFVKNIFFPYFPYFSLGGTPASIIYLLHEEYNCQKPFSSHQNYSQHGEASLSDPSSEIIQIWPKSQDIHENLRCRRGGQSPALSKAVGITVVMFSKCCKFTVSGISFYFSVFLLVEMVSSLLSVTQNFRCLDQFFKNFYFVVCLFFHGDG